MEDLKQALLTRKRYNDMPFDDFVKLVEEYIGEEISEEIKYRFKFTGLINTDFFMQYIDYEEDENKSGNNEESRCG